MAKQIRKRKCKNCKELFLPDYRNVKKQKFCTKNKCRQASKKFSNEKWLQKNKDYFKGPGNTKRVQQWREVSPKYQDNKKSVVKSLQDDCSPEGTVKQCDTVKLTKNALQENLTVQHPVIIGLIAKLSVSLHDDSIVGSLQDNIDNTIEDMRVLGRKILADSNSNIGGKYELKRTVKPPTPS
ncbi:MAG: hypothetical protein HN597_18520 [Desulfobacula sp.]|jgi:hypothetical protein|uniref:hypothetical protein n=1 Tax=Desulfobacula sp. TaxID=2593537 RepID=UPI0039B94640|nr:hypothetical protein [Desulfobacula sp.]